MNNSMLRTFGLIDRDFRMDAVKWSLMVLVEQSSSLRNTENAVAAVG